MKFSDNIKSMLQIWICRWLLACQIDHTSLMPEQTRRFCSAYC